MSSTNGISLADLDAGTSHVLTADRPSGDVAWSPDGRALAYIVLGGVLPFYRGDLRLARLDGTVRTLVRAAGLGGYISGLAWTRPAAGMRYRAAVGRSVATVTGHQLVAPWTITALAADRDRVAYVSCGHVFAWKPATGAVEQVEALASASIEWSLGDNYIAYQVYSVAVAGGRVAYAQAQGNTGQSFDLVAWQAIDLGADKGPGLRGFAAHMFGCLLR